MRKRILASIGIFFIVVIVALVGLFFLSQTQYFRNLARSTGEKVYIAGKIIVAKTRVTIPDQPQR